MIRKGKATWFHKHFSTPSVYTRIGKGETISVNDIDYRATGTIYCYGKVKYNKAIIEEVELRVYSKL